MCGRYTIHAEVEELVRRFLLGRPPARAWERYNVAPSQTVPIITAVDGRPALTEAKWGLVPAWSPTAGTQHKMINARAESLQTSRVYRSLLRGHRCLIPARGFYEWR